jgi:large subunit ribosomal protein L7e
MVSKFAPSQVRPLICSHSSPAPTFQVNLLKKQRSFKRAEDYVREYREQATEVRRMKRVARRAGNFYVPEQPKVALVIRIKGVNKIPPKPRKIMQLFRLRQINNATLVKLNKASIKMLRMAEPYISYGYPNLATLRNMLYKRGHLKVNGRRTPITDNNVIEQHLGKYNIVCIEDILHELFTVGKYFKQVNNFLWHFKLSNPRGGWRRKAHHYVEGGDHGNREDRINNLVKRMI